MVGLDGFEKVDQEEGPEMTQGRLRNMANGPQQEYQSWPKGKLSWDFEKLANMLI